MVKPVLEGITVLADDVNGLASFYRDALGLVPVVEEQFYVAFGGEGIRLAIFSRPGMGANTHDHGDYRTPSMGQAFELNFQCASRGEVDERYAWLSSHGAEPIALPIETDWGHYTGFFADPEGNIHSLFAVL